MRVNLRQQRRSGDWLGWPTLALLPLAVGLVRGPPGDFDCCTGVVRGGERPAEPSLRTQAAGLGPRLPSTMPLPTAVGLAGEMAAMAVAVGGGGVGSASRGDVVGGGEGRGDSGRGNDGCAGGGSGGSGDGGGSGGTIGCGDGGNTARDGCDTVAAAAAAEPLGTPVALLATPTRLPPPPAGLGNHVVGEVRVERGGVTPLLDVA